MATITTKFNVGDRAYTVDVKTMKIREFEIEGVCASIGKYGTNVSYRAKDGKLFPDCYDEEKCFATKHELLTYIEQPAAEENEK